MDCYNPTTSLSSNYNYWKSEIDLKVCPICKELHRKIYNKSEQIFPSPPLHLGCRYKIETLHTVKAGEATKDGKDGADYWLAYYGKLPDYYITSEELMELGWHWGDKPSKYAPGKMYTAGIYENSNKHLPEKPGRIWYEADVNYTPGRRNRHRILWSNDGLIFVTYDHYYTFLEINY